MALSPFHIAFPVRDVQEAREFYVGYAMPCMHSEINRSYDHPVTHHAPIMMWYYNSMLNLVTCISQGIRLQ